MAAIIPNRMHGFYKTHKNPAPAEVIFSGERSFFSSSTYAMQQRQGSRSLKTVAIIEMHHSPSVGTDQCCSLVVQVIHAPVAMVWSVVSNFEDPCAYKKFVRECAMRSGGEGRVGSVRELRMVSGLPATWSLERLEKVDEEEMVMVYSAIDGDHRLVHYVSTVSLHVEEEKTVAVESYVVDVPEGNTKEETCIFVDTLVRLSMRGLADVCEKMAAKQSLA